MSIRSSSTLVPLALALIAAQPAAARHYQRELVGPPGSSYYFGERVATLPNGNFVVVDSSAGSGAGAVYLYDSDGELISTLMGATIGDRVGIGGVTVLVNGNFVVSSPRFGAGNVGIGPGAATFVNGTTGLDGIVSAANSLVGDHPEDQVGTRVVALKNGNYVVVQPWNHMGAVTWGDGTHGVAGVISSANSLVGTNPDEGLGVAVTALANGDYTVTDASFIGPVPNGPQAAITLCGGTGGCVGTVQAATSLVGVDPDATVTELANGNLVVASQRWSSPANFLVGAATFVPRASGFSGVVSEANSLVGTAANDRVGSGIAALPNGNYIVSSPNWSDGLNTSVGAVTWGNGTGGTVGPVSAANSLIGSTSGDGVGLYGAVLANGNYVAGSPSWHNGMPFQQFGAATWMSGTAPTIGTVSVSNSLYGSYANDHVGWQIVPLKNGHYVVATPTWASTDHSYGFGAVTWCDGTGPTAAPVTSLNSFVGTLPQDRVGNGGPIALSDGNYVVGSYGWPTPTRVGAATWLAGSGPTTGTVSGENSVTGVMDDDFVGSSLLALPNGDYLVASAQWGGRAGAVARIKGGGPATGTLSASNALVGPDTFAFFGSGGLFLQPDGAVVIVSPSYDTASIYDAGAITLLAPNDPTIGTIAPFNSVIGTMNNSALPYAYDPLHGQLVVGHPGDGRVTLLTPTLFDDDFE